MRRILWFRRDLRIEDNPILSLGGDVLPIFIFDTNILGALSHADARVSFIFEAAQRLKKSLQAIGLDLAIFYGRPVEVFAYLLKMGFDEVVASGDYDAYAKERDLEISRLIEFRYKYSTYLFKPNEILKDDGSPYVVYKPYYTKARKVLESQLAPSLVAEHNLVACEFDSIIRVDGKSVSHADISLESIGFVQSDKGRFSDPHEMLESFIEKIEGYHEGRDYLNQDATSRLSVHIRFGTIGVREIVRRVLALKQQKDVEPYIRELIFRDYYAYLLFHFPRLACENFKGHFNGVANEEYFQAFCTAQTGFPIIDAAVTQLLSTGTMHNRARMFCASFFTKHLLLPWQWGERFFAAHLLDYDAASNILSWQWSASTGVDAQPYFRVFNPYTQGEKFDKEALYIKKYLPKLKDIEAKRLHNEEYLRQGLIADYPKPIVSHKEARLEAIEAFKIG